MSRIATTDRNLTMFLRPDMNAENLNAIILTCRAKQECKIDSMTVGASTWRLLHILKAGRCLLLAVFPIFDGDYFAGSRVCAQSTPGVPKDLLLQIAHARTAHAIANFEPFGIQR